MSRAAKSDTWMPLYIADYLRKTMHLTRDQHGGYLLLLMACWDRGGRLPNEPGQLAGIARATSAEWRKLAPVLLPFFEIDGRDLVQGRVIEEHAKAARLSEARRAAGSQGGRPRKAQEPEMESKPESEQKPKAFANQKQNETHTRVASPSPFTPPSEVKPPNPPNGGMSDETFEKIWKAYPEKGRSTVAKALGRKAVDEAVAAGGGPDQMLAAAQALTAGGYIVDGGKPLRFDRWITRRVFENHSPVAANADGCQPWPGPAEVWDAVIASGQTTAWAHRYLGACKIVGQTLYVASPTMAKGLKQAAGQALDEMGYRLVEGAAA